MRTRFIVIAGLCAALIGTAVPASAGGGLAASWLVTFYLDPTGAMGSTQCINFAAASNVNGIGRGKWRSPSRTGWHGQYVQRGQHFAFHGSYAANGATFVTYAAGDFINSNIAAVTSAATLKTTATGEATHNTGTATMVQVPNCREGPAHAGVDGDPMMP